MEDNGRLQGPARPDNGPSETRLGGRWAPRADNPPFSPRPRPVPPPPSPTKLPLVSAPRAPRGTAARGNDRSRQRRRGLLPPGRPGTTPRPPGTEPLRTRGDPGDRSRLRPATTTAPRRRAPSGAQRPRVGHAAGAPSPPRETKPAPRWGCGGGCPNTPSPLTMVRAAAPGRPPVRSGAAGKRLWGGHGRGPFHSTGHPPAPPSLLPPSAAQALGAGPGPPPGGAGGVRVRVRVSCLPPPPRPGLGAAAALRTVLRRRDRAEAGCLRRGVWGGGGGHTRLSALPPHSWPRSGGEGRGRRGPAGAGDESCGTGAPVGKPAAAARQPLLLLLLPRSSPLFPFALGVLLASFLSPLLTPSPVVFAVPGCCRRRFLLFASPMLCASLAFLSLSTLLEVAVFRAPRAETALWGGKRNFTPRSGTEKAGGDRAGETPRPPPPPSGRSPSLLRLTGPGC